MAYVTVHFTTRGTGPRRVRRGHCETIADTLDGLGVMDKGVMVVFRVSGTAAANQHLVETWEELEPDPADPGNNKMVTKGHRRYRIDMSTLMGRIATPVRNRIQRRMAKAAERTELLLDQGAFVGRGLNRLDRQRQKRRNFGPNKAAHSDLLANYTQSLADLDSVEQAIHDDYPTDQVTIPQIQASEILDDKP